jgi:hypothetical protein
MVLVYAYILPLWKLSHPETEKNYDRAFAALPHHWASVLEKWLAAETKVHSYT